MEKELSACGNQVSKLKEALAEQKQACATIDSGHQTARELLQEQIDKLHSQASCITIMFG